MNHDHLPLKSATGGYVPYTTPKAVGFRPDNALRSVMLTPPASERRKKKFSFKGLYKSLTTPAGSTNEAMVSDILTNTYRKPHQSHLNKLDLSLPIRQARPMSLPLPSPLTQTPAKASPSPHTNDSLPSPTTSSIDMLHTPVNQIYSFSPSFQGPPPIFSEPAHYLTVEEDDEWCPAPPNLPPPVKPFAYKRSLRRHKTLLTSTCCICRESLSSTLAHVLEKVLEMNCGHPAHQECFSEFVAYNAMTHPRGDSVAAMRRAIFGSCPECGRSGTPQPCVPSDEGLVDAYIAEALLTTPNVFRENKGAFQITTTNHLVPESLADPISSLAAALSTTLSTTPGPVSPRATFYPLHASLSSPRPLPTSLGISPLRRLASQTYLVPRNSPFVGHRRGSSISGVASVISSASPTRLVHSRSVSPYTRPSSVKSSLYSKMPLAVLRAKFTEELLGRTPEMKYGSLRLVDRLAASLELHGEYRPFTVMLFERCIVLVAPNCAKQTIELPVGAKIYAPSSAALKIVVDQDVCLFLRPQDDSLGTGVLEKWGIAFLDAKFVFPSEIFTSTVVLLADETGKGASQEVRTPTPKLVTVPPSELVLVLHNVRFQPDEIAVFQNILRGLLILELRVNVVAEMATFPLCLHDDVLRIGTALEYFHEQPAGATISQDLRRDIRKLVTASDKPDEVATVVFTTENYTGAPLTDTLMLQIGGHSSNSLGSWDAVMETMIRELRLEAKFDQSFESDSEDEDSSNLDKAPEWTETLDNDDDSDSDEELINQLVQKHLPLQASYNESASESDSDDELIHRIIDLNPHVECETSPSEGSAQNALTLARLCASDEARPINIRKPDSLRMGSSLTQMSLTPDVRSESELLDLGESPLRLRLETQPITMPRMAAYHYPTNKEGNQAGRGATNDWKSLFADIDRALDETRCPLDMA
ncbi:hypothetical protein BABINDRAFT_153092 [Babjeviella inositovora NRRL Y-12698]|uniref:RING-type domain-containing protein n=1 Tax=Babjeviella inositovora NRRL Y-12698 TaxID=984486 RepID=A0A1E3QNY2_9ASCO|nr:uncharacterized protein BABINDRAFT_153092 [Babjeviella inositovora NRRL Y-12698]ODQ78792.1 hypothetical protein BABINDRAFT_153092 [Babjeviella inositovora NRRL Y-12698]